MNQKFSQPQWNILSAFIYSYDIIFDINKEKINEIIRPFDQPVCQMALIEYFDECIIKDDSNDVIFNKLINRLYDELKEVDVLKQKLQFYQDMKDKKTRLFLRKYDEFLIEKQHVVRKKNHKEHTENIAKVYFRSNFLFKGKSITDIIEEINNLNIEYAGVFSLGGKVYFHMDKIDVGQIKKLIENADETEEYWKCGHEIEDQAKNLIKIFGTAEKAIKFILKRNNKKEYNYQDIHQIGNIFAKSNNFKKWIPYIMEKPTMIDELGVVFHMYEDTFGEPCGDINVIIEKLNKIKENYFKENPQELAFLYCENENEKETYVKFFKDNKPKTKTNVPEPIGVQSSNYTLTQLKSDDPLQAVVGVLTNCCQHINGAAAKCAEKAYTDENCAVWVVLKETKIIAQAFVWRPKDTNVLIIDSIESLVKSVNIVDLYIKASMSVLGQLGIEKVYIGVNHSGIGHLYTNNIESKKIIKNTYDYIADYFIDSEKITLVASI